MNHIDKIIYKRISIALLFFLISAVYGFLMRWQKVQNIFSYSYTDVMQAHSHVTFLGWGFLASISLVTGAFFLSKQQIDKSQMNPVFTYTFWMMSGSIVAMLISFPLQGYKFFSISFLSLFLLTSYVYLFYLYKQLKQCKTLSSRFIKTAIHYYYISSLAIWALSVITVTIGRGDVYHIAIRFYTHFLYNGFFVMVLFGLLVRYIEHRSIAVSTKAIHYFYTFTKLAIFPTFALSLLDKPVPVYIVAIGYIGVLSQLVSLFYLGKISKKLTDNKAFGTALLNFLFKLIVFSYFIKLILQLMSAFPEFTIIAMKYKPFFVIAYIHLFTLGFLSLFLLLLLELILVVKLFKWGVYLLVIGIICTEFILFTQGFLSYFNRSGFHNFNELMVSSSTLMPLGILVIYLGFLLKEKPNKSTH